MSATDVILAAVILGAALLLLFRTLRRSCSGRACHGCSGSCGEVKRAGLVQLSGPKREG